MSTNPKSRIQDIFSKAMAATDPGQVETIVSELRVALYEKIQSHETWMSLCAQAAVEKDPKKLLDLVTEINRLFEAREKRLTVHDGPGKSSSDHESLV